MTKKLALLPALFALLSIPAVLCGAAEWKIQENPILSPWAEQVSPENAHPEYPRPQFVRKDWVNLNGLWDYAIIKAGEHVQKWDGKILV
ncbi:MAG: hypothetical protein IJF17_07710, partial [Thermoguttaceae bacterium]|nr:hypothetical protein [Thermoguttaceae bacterium]